MLNTLNTDVAAARATTSLLTTALITVAGCAVVDDNVPEVGVDQQNIISPNIISPNIISPNIISPNIISPNIISPNIISPNGTLTETLITFNGFSLNPTYGISVGGLGIDEVAVDGLRINDTGTAGITLHGVRLDAAQEADFQVVLRYAIQCALSAGQSAIVHDSQGKANQYDGLMGLAPEWKTGAISTVGRRYVSACLAARSNGQGKRVMVSLRGGTIPVSAIERTTYSHHEGAFWGDVFADQPYVHTCQAQGAGISGRVCTSGDCGFTAAGKCADVCTTKDATDGTYSSCNGEMAVINTYLPITEDIDFGQEHNCKTDEQGWLWCWGENSRGELGDSTSIDRLTPSPRTFAGKRVVEAAGGARHSCVRLNDGTVWCTGDNQYGQLGDASTAAQEYELRQVGALGADVFSLGVGSAHACALQSSGALYCWGDNLQGQLGNGTSTAAASPVHVAALGADVIRFATGNSASHTCAVTTDGSLHCWGWNSAGQLGDGTLEDRSMPTEVAYDATGSSFDEITDVCTGWLHTCARQADGSVWCFGSNDKGRLGSPQITADVQSRPVRVSLPRSAIQGGLSCSMDHSCATLDDGSLYCWGGNEYGQLGNGLRDAKGSATPIQVVGLQGAVAFVSTGASHTCAGLDDGSLYCWGQDSGKVLFGGSTALPVQLAMPSHQSYAPASFKVTFDATLGMNIGSWQKHLAPNLSHYEFYRNGRYLGRLGADAVSGTDLVSNSGKYCYKMRAMFTDGTTSEFTQEICNSVSY